jgi:hypothetical protein
MKLICPKCNAEAKLYLDDANYSGPRRCWKCHEFFTITIHNNQVTSCEPLSPEEYDRQQAEKAAREKMRGSVSYASQEKPKAYQKPPAQPQMEMEFPSKDMPEVFPKPAAKPQSAAETPGQDKADFFQSAPATSKGGIEFSGGGKADAAQKPAETPKGGIDFVKRDEPAAAPQPADKPQGGIEFGKREEPATPAKAEDKPRVDFKQAAPKRPMDSLWDNLKSSSQKAPPSPADTGKPAIFPPERYSTFVPQENLDIAPEQSPKSKLFKDKKPGYMKSTGEIVPEQPTVFPPEKYRTFVPQEDDEKEDKKRK